MRQFIDVIARKRPMPEETGRAPAPDSAVPGQDFVSQAVVAAGRPPAADPDDPGLGADASGATTAFDPADGTDAAGATSAAPQIWDLDPPDPVAEASFEAPEPAAEPLRRRRIAAAGPVAAATPGRAPVAPPAASRARTRVLGFAAAEIAHDVFAGDRVAPGAVARFPAGWIVVVEGPGRGASFTLGAGVSTIGRAPDQTVALDFGDMAISREMHASIAYDEEQNRFFVGHGGKSNIVRRNGAPVLSTEELFHGDILRIGRTALRFVALCGPEFTWGDRSEDEA